MYTEKEKALLVGMMIQTAISCVPVESKPKAVSKLARVILNNLRKQSRSLGAERYNEIAKVSYNAWVKMKSELSEDFTVSMAQLINALESLLINSEYRFLMYSEKNFNGAFNSLIGNHRYEYDQQLEDNSNNLVKEFEKEIGIKRETTLSRLRIINEQNLILEGKTA